MKRGSNPIFSTGAEEEESRQEPLIFDEDDFTDTDENTIEVHALTKQWKSIWCQVIVMGTLDIYWRKKIKLIKMAWSKV